MFISSISASVGAFSKTLGLGRCWGRAPERSMQEVDLTSLAQAFTMQGREPNPGRGRRRGEGCQGVLGGKLPAGG